MKPEDVHPSHNVREEGLYISDPVCQLCGASVFGTPERLLIDCGALLNEPSPSPEVQAELERIFRAGLDYDPTAVIGGRPAQGIETAKPPRREAGLARKGESPVAESHAPSPSLSPRDRGVEP